jgi:hypothetical protein
MHEDAPAHTYIHAHAHAHKQDEANTTMLLARAPVDRKYAWWMERPNGALMYFREIVADRGLSVDPEALLSQVVLVCIHRVLAVSVLCALLLPPERRVPIPKRCSHG